MRRTTITLPQRLVDELVEVTGASSKTHAVIRAIEEELRKRKLENIKGMAGKLTFDVEAEELRHGNERLG
ncbi:MAG: hypothetical protein DDT24_00692 [Chloroflexi bacterium]|nr:hypothetical protein [Chloroflexota bacterium]